MNCNPNKNQWSQYREQHKWVRVETFPEGVEPPRKVRLYRQNSYYRLQWWAPREKRNLSDRVDGDLIAAISRAREIDEQILNFRSSGLGNRHLKHEKLITQFREDLQGRANAGEIRTATVTRYGSALDHYQNFCTQPIISSKYPSASQVDRAFAQKFQAWLENLQISSNGHPHTPQRPMKSGSYVIDVVRGMFEWAADPDRGNLLPAGFRNPFKGRLGSSHGSSPDLFGEPDITITMAAEFLKQCDPFQLPLFSVMILCGLRASEPCWLMRENLSPDGWLKVVSLPELGYTTKGRRDKRFPLPDSVKIMLKDQRFVVESKQGLLFRQRSAWRQTNVPICSPDLSLEQLEMKYKKQCGKLKNPGAKQKQQIRNKIMKEAGALNYDRIGHEFRRVVRDLNWPDSATLKDFRHLFSTELMNAGVPDYYRKYLMGHSVPNVALTSYTHLNELESWYSQAIQQRFTPILTAITDRMNEFQNS